MRPGALSRNSLHQFVWARAFERIRPRGDGGKRRPHLGKAIRHQKLAVPPVTLGAKHEVIWLAGRELRTGQCVRLGCQQLASQIWIGLIADAARDAGFRGAVTKSSGYEIVQAVEALVNDEPFFAAGVLAFTISFAVKLASPQVFLRTLSATETADASSSPTSPARISSVQSKAMPRRLAAYSIAHPTMVHHVLNLVFDSWCFGRFFAPAISNV